MRREAKGVERREGGGGRPYANGDLELLAVDLSHALNLGDANNVAVLEHVALGLDGGDHAALLLGDGVDEGGVGVLARGVEGGVVAEVVEEIAEDTVDVTSDEVDAVVVADLVDAEHLVTGGVAGEDDALEEISIQGMEEIIIQGMRRNEKRSEEGNEWKEGRTVYSQIMSLVSLLLFTAMRTRSLSSLRRVREASARFLPTSFSVRKNWEERSVSWTFSVSWRVREATPMRTMFFARER